MQFTVNAVDATVVCSSKCDGTTTISINIVMHHDAIGRASAYGTAR